MKAKRETPKRRRQDRGRTRRFRPAGAGAAADPGSARRTRPGRSLGAHPREPRAQVGTADQPHRPAGRAAGAAQEHEPGQGRAKARKAKAPKVIRPRLSERLAARLASIDLRPRTLASKVPFVVLVIGALGVGLGLTLWLSTDSAERSYQLSHAREKTRLLQQQKEALERDVREAESAPALAEAARKQGMIPTRDTAHLVQDPSGNWVVVGTPKPADGVPPPPLNTKLPEQGPPPPPEPPALPPEVPVRVQPEPAAPAPARSGPEALLRAPDGASTLGGQHLAQTATPAAGHAGHAGHRGGPRCAAPAGCPGAGAARAGRTRARSAARRGADPVGRLADSAARAGARTVTRGSAGSGAAGDGPRGSSTGCPRRPRRPGAPAAACGAGPRCGAGCTPVSRGDSMRTRRSQATRGPRKAQEAKGVRQPKRRVKQPQAQDVREPKRSRKAKGAKDAKKARPADRSDAVATGHSARERRTRQLVQAGTRGASFVFRHRAGNAVDRGS